MQVRPFFAVFIFAEHCLFSRVAPRFSATIFDRGAFDRCLIELKKPYHN